MFDSGLRELHLALGIPNRGRESRMVLLPQWPDPRPVRHVLHRASENQFRDRGLLASLRWLLDLLRERHAPRRALGNQCRLRVLSAGSLHWLLDLHQERHEPHRASEIPNRGRESLMEWHSESQLRESLRSQRDQSFHERRRVGRASCQEHQASFPEACRGLRVSFPVRPVLSTEQSESMACCLKSRRNLWQRPIHSRPLPTTTRKPIDVAASESCGESP